MNTYLCIKVIHVVSSTILFGTGLGIAFFKWTTDRSCNLVAIRIVSERVVLADWLFTTPSIIVQAITGVWLASIAGFPITHGWVAYAIALYLIAGTCWLPVVWMQIRMRNLARDAERNGLVLTSKYYTYARFWFWLGIPAFFSLLAVFWLMVAKPAL